MHIGKMTLQTRRHKAMIALALYLLSAPVMMGTLNRLEHVWFGTGGGGIGYGE